MFHLDCTMEDVRIIAAEHRVETPDPQHAAEGRGDGLVHDGTFDVKHVDGHTGQEHTVNLSTEALAEVIRVGLSGDDSEHAYANEHIKDYQAKMKGHEALSFIP